MCVGRRRDVLDAPVSGGRPAAEARTMTTMVGGPEPFATRCEPVLRSFSRHVAYFGGPGSGQSAKLFNIVLLIMNRANIADIVELAGRVGVDPVRLVAVLKLGSASNGALTLLNAMVRIANVEHLAGVEALDMDANQLTSRGLVGAEGLPELVRRLNP
jgi:3-hydroxyisobutyrate dehydrogenase-like beta-hydroxyacid dehydrogenase